MGHHIIKKISDVIDASKGKSGIEILTDSHGDLEISICNWEGLTLEEIRDNVGSEIDIYVYYIFGVLHLVEETNFMNRHGLHISTLFRKDIDVGEFNPVIIED